MLHYTRTAVKFIQLTRNLKKSRDEIISIRENKFRHILQHAYDHSEFYRTYYSDHGIKEKDLKVIPIDQLPSIDKSTFIENFDQITIDPNLTRAKIDHFTQTNSDHESKYLGKYNIVHSSGSTGQPTYFVYDDQAWETIQAASVRAARGDVPIRRVFTRGINVAYIAATEGRFGGVMAATAGIKGFGFTPLILNVNLPIEQWIHQINTFKPSVIIGYPSAIKILGDLVVQGKVQVDIFGLIVGGEPLTKQLRDYFESVFDVEVMNIYGASESIILGLERQDTDGIYLFDDLNYFEVGEDATYITSLYNHAQPMIRYKLSDKLIKAERGTDEKLPFTKVKSIMGRNEEIMWFLNEHGQEDFLHPLIIDDIDTEGRIYYQFIQHSQQEFEIDIEILDGSPFYEINREIRQNMNQMLEEKGLTNLKYTVKEVDSIPINPRTGKRKMVLINA